MAEPHTPEPEAPVPVAARGADSGGVISGMTEAGIRAAIAQLELLLPDRRLSVNELWASYAATLPVDQQWTKNVKWMMVKPLESLGNIQVVALRPSDWSEYKNGPGRSLSPTTRNLSLRRMRAMLNWAVDEGRIYDCPFRRTKTEKARGKRRTEIAEKDDDRVADATPLEVSVLYQVMAGTGMRIGEVRQLRWEQIDFDANTISLAWDESKGKEAAVINVTQDGMDALRLMPRLPGSPYVFPSPRRGGRRPLSYAHFYAHLRGAFDKLGLKAAPGDGRVHPHDTRHSAATRMNRRGAKLTDIQGVLRHANVAQTALYIVTRADEIKAAAALLAQPRKGPRRADGSAKVSPARPRARANAL